MSDPRPVTNSSPVRGLAFAIPAGLLIYALFALAVFLIF
jgi:hypothetical protein